MQAFSTANVSSSMDEDVTSPHPNDANLCRYGMPLLSRAAHHARSGRTLAYDLYKSDSNQTAEVAERKVAHTYREILEMSTHIHKHLVNMRSKDSSKQESTHEAPPRIAFLCSPGPNYIATIFAAWSSGSIAVPLCISHQAKELAYVLKDSDPDFIIDGTTELSDGRQLRLAAREAGLMGKYLCLDDLMADSSNDTIEDAAYALGANGDIPSIESPALMIYTSGTTGDPKGVVSESSDGTVQP